MSAHVCRHPIAHKKKGGERAAYTMHTSVAPLAAVRLAAVHVGDLVEPQRVSSVEGASYMIALHV